MQQEGGRAVALEELTEAFGGNGYERQTYVEFELDEEDRKTPNSAAASTQNLFNHLVLSFLAVVATSLNNLRFVH